MARHKIFRHCSTVGHALDTEQLCFGLMHSASRGQQLKMIICTPEQALGAAGSLPSRCRSAGTRKACHHPSPGPFISHVHHAHSMSKPQPQAAKRRCRASKQHSNLGTAPADSRLIVVFTTVELRAHSNTHHCGQVRRDLTCPCFLVDEPHYDGIVKPEAQVAERLPCQLWEILQVSYITHCRFYKALSLG